MENIETTPRKPVRLPQVKHLITKSPLSLRNSDRRIINIEVPQPFLYATEQPRPRRKRVKSYIPHKTPDIRSCQ